MIVKLYPYLRKFINFARPSRHFGQASASTHPHLFTNDNHTTPGIHKDEYRLRREKLVDGILKNIRSREKVENAESLRHLVIISGATLKYMSHDIPYTFRQDTSFLYLTGFMEPDALLVMECGGGSDGGSQEGVTRTVLFVPRRDAHKEMWEGERSGTTGAQIITGINETLNIDELSRFFDDYTTKLTSSSSFNLNTAHSSESYNPANDTTSRITTSPTTTPTTSPASTATPPDTPSSTDSTPTPTDTSICSTSHDASSSSVSTNPCGHTHTLLWYDPRQLSDAKVSNQIRDTIGKFVKNFKPKELRNPAMLMQCLRVVKSPAEIALMRQSCIIASQAIASTMRGSVHNVTEGELYARVDYECRLRGAQYLAYIPVVAGGNRANTIHYIKNNAVVKNDELVLMDAGCEFNGYASDITRTWPVNGKFTNPQRILYEVLLNTQLECLKIGNQETPFSLQTLYNSMISILGKELVSAGILPSTLTSVELLQAVKQLCPHHVGHFLGMDVHDTDLISRDVKLVEGMVITVEPGIYIPADCDISYIPECFKGIGLRIEDDVAIGEHSSEVLTKLCPKHVDDIESEVAKRL